MIIGIQVVGQWSFRIRVAVQVYPPFLFEQDNAQYITCRAIVSVQKLIVIPVVKLLLLQPGI